VIPTHVVLFLDLAQQEDLVILGQAEGQADISTRVPVTSEPEKRKRAVLDRCPSRKILV
jgi:hypothetical protein